MIAVHVYTHFSFMSPVSLVQLKLSLHMRGENTLANMYIRRKNVVVVFQGTLHLHHLQPVVSTASQPPVTLFCVNVSQRVYTLHCIGHSYSNKYRAELTALIHSWATWRVHSFTSTLERHACRLPRHSHCYRDWGQQDTETYRSVPPFLT